jgi:hypothetical protein
MRRIGRVSCAVFIAMVLSSSSGRTRTPGTDIEDAMRNTPLLVARQNLLIARSFVVKRSYSKAIPPLLTTAEALALFEEQGTGENDGIGVAAGDVRQEILNYATGIETDNSDALLHIDSWLDQIKRWNERRRSWPRH